MAYRNDVAICFAKRPESSLIQTSSREKLIDIGPLKVTASERKTIPLPPIVGGIALAAGIALILADQKKK
jgi:hypothetical protein